MKSLMVKITITLFLSFCMTALLAQEANNDALYRKLVREYTLNKDGSYDFHLYKEVEILTYYAFHRLFGETFIIYNPDYQKLRINQSYTVMADGKKVMAPDNAFNEVLPRYASNATAFNGLREMVVTHTGLERGAVIYLDYTVHSSATFMPSLMGNEVIPTDAPIKEMELIVRVPEGKLLSHKAFSISQAPEISSSGGMTVYSWKFRQVDAISAEGHQVDTDLPRVLFSTGGDLKRVFFSFVNQPAFTYPTNEQMDKAVEKLVAELGEDELKIALKLQDMVANDIATYYVPPEINGFRVRTPLEVWNTNGGTALEKALLLNTLLLKANISATPVAVIPDIFFDEEHGNLMVFESFLVQVDPKKYSRSYLSATGVDAQNVGYSLGGKKLLVLDGAIESLKTYEEKGARSSIRCGGKFAYEDGKTIKGDFMAEMANQANPYFNLLQDSTKVKGLFHGAKVTEFEFRTFNESRAVADLKVESSMALRSQSTYHFWEIPESKQGFASWHLDYMPEKRQNNLEVPGPLYERYEFTLSLPGNYMLVTPTNTVDIDNDYGKVKITLTMINNDVVINRELEIKQQVIPAANYPDFKAVVDAWINDRYRTLVFKKTE